jgi:hypothetical protein
MPYGRVLSAGGLLRHGGLGGAVRTLTEKLVRYQIPQGFRLGIFPVSHLWILSTAASTRHPIAAQHTDLAHCRALWQRGSAAGEKTKPAVKRRQCGTNPLQTSVLIETASDRREVLLALAGRPPCDLV